jgi:hypothetical protein
MVFLGILLSIMMNRRQARGDGSYTLVGNGVSVAAQVEAPSFAIGVRATVVQRI